jgi:molybdopterin converting factor small subunit
MRVVSDSYQERERRVPALCAVIPENIGKMPPFKNASGKGFRSGEMTFRLRFFGVTADIVGSRNLELTLSESATAESLVDRLSNDNPALKDHKLLIAVNEQYADADTILNDGDEIAIFTAVSGG